MVFSVLSGRGQSLRPKLRPIAPLAVIAVLSVPFVALADDAPDGPGPVPPPESAPMTIKELKKLAVPGSCASDPAAAKCPKVKKLKFIVNGKLLDETTPEGEPTARSARKARRSARRPVKAVAALDGDDVGYAPLAGAAATSQIPPGFACAFRAYPPYTLTYSSGNVVARVATDNKCRSGVGVSYVETNLCLQRYDSPNQGAWGNLNCDIDSQPADGSIGSTFTTVVQYDCHHSSVWAYRNSTISYSILNGTGYFGYAFKYANLTCWP